MEFTKEQKKVIKQADIIEKAFEKIIELGGHMAVNIDGELHEVWAMAKGDESHNVEINPAEFIIVLPS